MLSNRGHDAKIFCALRDCVRSRVKRCDRPKFISLGTLMRKGSQAALDICFQGRSPGPEIITMSFLIHMERKCIAY